MRFPRCFTLWRWRAWTVISVGLQYWKTQLIVTPKAWDALAKRIIWQLRVISERGNISVYYILVRKFRLCPYITQKQFVSAATFRYLTLQPATLRSTDLRCHDIQSTAGFILGRTLSAADSLFYVTYITGYEDSSSSAILFQWSFSFNFNSNLSDSFYWTPFLALDNFWIVFA